MIYIYKDTAVFTVVSMMRFRRFLKDRRGISRVLWALAALGGTAVSIGIALYFQTKANSVADTAETKINGQINSA